MGGGLLLSQIGVDQIRTGWVDEQRDAVGRWDHFMQQFESLRSYRHVPSGYPGHVATWSMQAGDKSQFDRVQSYVEDDWDRGGRCLGRQCSGGTGRHSNHSHLTTNQIVRQRRKSIVPTLCPAIFNRHVPAFDITGFFQALVEGGQTERVGLARAGADASNHRHRWLLRPRRYRPRRRRTTEQRDELAPPDHSITSSARASSVAGTSRPSARAVLI